MLQGKPQLTLEQAIRANRALAHTKAEGQYFLLLVQLERAGTRELAAHFEEQLSDLRKEQTKVRAHIGKSDELSDAAKSVYYSSWTYPALHMLAVLPESADSDSLSRRLGISRQELEARLKTLEGIGLIKREKGKLELTQQRIHISGGSPHASSYHSQCRVRSLQSIARANPDHLHFSSYICHSRSDAEKIKDLLMKCIKSVEETYRPSPEETVFGFNLDYFEI